MPIKKNKNSATLFYKKQKKQVALQQCSPTQANTAMHEEYEQVSPWHCWQKSLITWYQQLPRLI